MSGAGDKMKALIIDVTPTAEELLKQFVRECCSNNNNETYTFSKTSLEYFIKEHQKDELK